MKLIRKFMDLLNMNNWSVEESENLNNELDDVIESFDEFQGNDAVEAAPAPAPAPAPKLILEPDILSSADFENNSSIENDEVPYRSKRLIIPGLHIHFIDIARDIVQEQMVNTIPLMREYNISESDLKQVIDEIYKAQIIDHNNNVLMNTEELEKFLDIYEPNLFLCPHTIFDKDIFGCIGEIIFDNGIEETYTSLPADELIDYLNIMEALKIIRYNRYENKYDIVVSKNDYIKIYKSIPEYFGSKDFDIENAKYNTSDIDSMSGIEFENYVACILHQNGFFNIKTTPASGDHGIDLTAVKDDITYAIQCKCYSSNVGNSAVQQAHTGKSLYHKDIAVVATNSYFTQQALDEAAELGVKLWDRDKLNSLIESAT